MPSITPTSAGGYRVQIFVKGIRDSETFPNKRAAQQWAARRETEIRAMANGNAGTVKTLADALNRYAEEISPSKRGARWEVVRLKAFQSDAHKPLPVKKRLSELAPADIANWRDARLRVTQKGSVLRELGLLSAVLTVARRDWQWIDTNPVADILKPTSPRHRDRVISPQETRKILRALGHGGPVRSVQQSVAAAFLLAQRTGMRAGELCSLQWNNVHDDFCLLPITKNGEARQVPLLPAARRTIERLRGWDEHSVFGIKAASLDALFRKARTRAGLGGFTFHDSRHTAATRLSPRMDVLDLCKMFGWKQTDQALTYYNPTAKQILARMR
jgi:integrase